MTCRCYHWFEIIQHSRSDIAISILKVYNKSWSIISIWYRYFFFTFFSFNIFHCSKRKPKDKTEDKEHRQCSNVLITHVYIFSLIIISPITLKKFKILCPTFHLENPILDMQYCCARCLMMMDIWYLQSNSIIWKPNRECILSSLHVSGW
jgi:hypothetical protein